MICEVRNTFSCFVQSESSIRQKRLLTPNSRRKHNWHWHCTTLYHIIPHLPCAALYHIVPHCTALHYTSLLFNSQFKAPLRIGCRSIFRRPVSTHHPSLFVTLLSFLSRWILAISWHCRISGIYLCASIYFFHDSARLLGPFFKFHCY